MKDGIIISALSIVPKKPVARLMGRATRIQLPGFMHRLLIRYFVKKYQVNLDECEGNIDDFRSLSEFFIRPLKDGVRKIEKNENSIVSPVDGKIHSFGRITNGLFAQSESQQGSVTELLGTGQDSPESNPKRYQNGSYIIIYLSPQDYHRVHIHSDGALTKTRYQPGRLWPVFPVATKKIKSLFDKNERLVFFLQHKGTYSVLAMIGAFGVGRMASQFCSVISNTNCPASEQIFTPPTEVSRGDEIGQFELGSTVILLFEDKDLKWTVEPNQKIQLGNEIGRKV
jgi:phosphatidylserine decarboxylase